MLLENAFFLEFPLFFSQLLLLLFENIVEVKKSHGLTMRCLASFGLLPFFPLLILKQLLQVGHDMDFERAQWRRF